MSLVRNWGRATPILSTFSSIESISFSMNQIVTKRQKSVVKLGLESIKKIRNCTNKEYPRALTVLKQSLLLDFLFYMIINNLVGFSLVWCENRMEKSLNSYSKKIKKYIDFFRCDAYTVIKSKKMNLR